MAAPVATALASAVPASPSILRCSDSTAHSAAGRPPKRARAGSYGCATAGDVWSTTGSSSPGWFGSRVKLKTQLLVSLLSGLALQLACQQERHKQLNSKDIAQDIAQSPMTSSMKKLSVSLVVSLLSATGGVTQHRSQLKLTCRVTGKQSVLLSGLHMGIAITCGRSHKGVSFSMSKVRMLEGGICLP